MKICTGIIARLKIIKTYGPIDHGCQRIVDTLRVIITSYPFNLFVNFGLYATLGSLIILVFLTAKLTHT